LPPRSALVSCDSGDEVLLLPPQISGLSSTPVPLFTIALPCKLVAIAEARLGMVNLICYFFLFLPVPPAPAAPCDAPCGQVGTCAGRMKGHLRQLVYPGSDVPPFSLSTDVFPKAPMFIYEYALVLHVHSILPQGSLLIGSPFFLEAFKQ
jgi:hypothetical protein